MEEKKLTDEEIVKALEHCYHNRSCEYCYHNDEAGSGEIVCRARLMEKALDLIHRLQDENNQIKSNKFASWKLKFFRLKEEFDKELSEHEEFTKKAKAEIERLTKENKQLEEEIDLEVDLQTQRKRQIIAESQEFIDELANKNAELQKQVDELKEQLLIEKLKGLTEGYLDGVQAERNAQIIKPLIVELPKEITQKIKEQVVKDTAKEIYGEINDSDILVVQTQEYGEIEVVPIERLKEIIKSKGVEVE